jgi:hypothetical protein
MFSFLDPDGTRKTLDSVEKLTDCELFQSLASELVSPNIQIHCSNEADKESCGFAASVALAYRLSTRKTIILYQKYETRSLYRLLKHKRKLRILWQETRDPAWKTTVNLVTQNIWRMVRKEHGTAGNNVSKVRSHISSNVAYCEFVRKRDGPKAPSGIHAPLGLIFYPIDKANLTADCLENQFRAHDMCNCDHT